MTSDPRWLTRSRADVPPGDEWLGARERAAQGSLRLPHRREDWRLGRWTAKCLLSAITGADPARLEVIAAADGAPEAWLDGARLPLAISLSHRAGHALAVAGPGAVGCDLEAVEPRSDGFVADWLAPIERLEVAGLAGEARDVAVNLRWTAKEAAAKVRREGLRLDVRQAVSRPAGGPGEWHALVVEWAGESLRTSGWWRAEPGWVMAVASDRPCGPPVRV